MEAMRKQQQFFIGVKRLKAEKMNLGCYNKFRGWDIPKDENPLKKGYLVEYEDGYLSWSPKETFERSYFELSVENKITNNDVNKFIGDVKVSKLDKKTTLVTSEGLTGFVSHEVSSCVDPANYNEEIGKEIGIERIQNKIYPCLGFVLQWALNGLKQGENNE